MIDKEWTPGPYARIRWAFLHLSGGIRAGYVGTASGIDKYRGHQAATPAPIRIELKETKAASSLMVSDRSTALIATRVRSEIRNLSIARKVRYCATSNSRERISIGGLEIHKWPFRSYSKAANTLSKRFCTTLLIAKTGGSFACLISRPLIRCCELKQRSPDRLCKAFLPRRKILGEQSLNSISRYD